MDTRQLPRTPHMALGGVAGLAGVAVAGGVGGVAAAGEVAPPPAAFGFGRGV